jgi:hypothetical protein
MYAVDPGAGRRQVSGDLVTATPSASGEALDSELLLVEILGEAHDDDRQLRALHRAIEAAVALPLDVHVVGEPLVLVTVEYDGNARRGLVARCRREDGSEHRIGLADVEMPARTPGARQVAAYCAWLGIIPAAGASPTTPRSRRQHKAGDDDLDLSRPVELVVLAVKERAARCRLLGSGRVITLGSASAGPPCGDAPGSCGPAARCSSVPVRVSGTAAPYTCSTRVCLPTCRVGVDEASVNVDPPALRPCCSRVMLPPSRSGRDRRRARKPRAPIGDPRSHRINASSLDPLPSIT